METTALINLRNRLSTLPRAELPLNPETLGTDEFATDWKKTLGVEELRLLGARVSAAQSDGNFVVRGKANLLGFLNARIAVVFFLAKEGASAPALQCLVLVAPQKLPWRLNTVYPQLPDDTDYSTATLAKIPSPLAELDFRALYGGYSTVDFFPRAPEEPQLETTLRGRPDISRRPLRRGWNYRARVNSETPALARLRSLAPQLGELSCVGVVSEGEDGLCVEVFSDLPGLSVSLDPADRLSARLERLAIRSGIGGDFAARPQLVVYASLGSDDFRMQLEIPIFRGIDLLSVRARFGDRVVESAADPAAELLTLDRVASLFGLDGFAGGLPGPLDQLGGVGLREFSLSGGLSPRRVDRLEFALTAEDEFEIIPGVLRFKPTLLFDIDAPFDREKRDVDLTLAGRAGLGSADFDVYFEPESGAWRMQLAVGESIDADAVIESILPADIDLPEIEILDLDLEGNYKEKTFRAYIEIGSNIGFEVGGKEISLKNAQIEVEKSESERSGRLFATLDAAGWEASVAIKMDRVLEIKTILPEVNVSELVEEFLATIQLPADLPDFVIRDLNLMIQPKTKVFQISGSSDSVITLYDGVELKVGFFEVERDAAGKTECLLNLELAIDGQPLLLSARRSSEMTPGGAWRFSGSTGAGVEISVAALIETGARLAGADLPELPDALQLRDLQLEYEIPTRFYNAVGACEVEFAWPWSAERVQLRATGAVRSARDAAGKPTLVRRLEAQLNFAGAGLTLKALLQPGEQIWQGRLANLNLGAILREIGESAALAPEIPDATFRSIDFELRRGQAAPFFINAESDLKWTLFEFLHIESVRLRLLRPAAGAPIQKRIGGDFRIAGVRAEIFADIGPQLLLSATLGELNAGAFVSDLFDSALEEIGAAGALIRNALGLLRLQNAVLTIGGGAQPSLRLSGQPGDLDCRVEVSAFRSGGRFRFAALVVPGPGFRFTSLLGGEFAFLDSIFPNKTGAMLGFSPGGFSPGASPQFSGNQPPASMLSGPGASLSAEISLRGTGVDALFGVDSVRVTSTFAGPLGVLLAVPIIEDRGDNGATFQLREVTLLIRPTAPPGFGLSGRMVLRVDDPPLDFTITGIVEPTAAYIRGRLAEWDTPFGIPGLNFREVWLEVGGNAVGVPSLGMAMQARIASFEGGGALRFDSGNPARCMAALNFNELGFAPLLLSLFGNRIPDVATRLIPLRLQNVNIQIVPPGGAFGGYQEGFRLEGAALFGLGLTTLRGELKMRIELTSGIYAEGWIEPLRIERFFALEAADGASGPRVKLDLTLAQMNPEFQLSGALRVLGLTVQGADVRLSAAGLRTEFSRNIGPAEYTVAAGITRFDDPANLQLALSGRLKLRIRVRVPALKLPNPLPIGGDIPIWPAFTLDVEAGGALEARVGRDNRVALRGFGFAWGGRGFRIPDLVIDARVDDITQLPGLLERHVLDNIENIFSDLIDEARRKALAGLGEVQKIAEKTGEYVLEGAGYVRRGGEYIAEGAQYAARIADYAKQIDDLARRAAAHLADAARYAADATRYAADAGRFLADGARHLREAEEFGREAARFAEIGAGHARDAALWLADSARLRDVARGARAAANELRNQANQVYNFAGAAADQAADIALRGVREMENVSRQLASQARNVAEKSLEVLKSIGRAIANGLNPSRW